MQSQKFSYISFLARSFIKNKWIKKVIGKLQNVIEFTQKVEKIKLIFSEEFAKNRQSINGKRQKHYLNLVSTLQKISTYDNRLYTHEKLYYSLCKAENSLAVQLYTKTIKFAAFFIIKRFWIWYSQDVNVAGIART